jgi:hypothetical protein
MFMRVLLLTALLGLLAASLYYAIGMWSAFDAPDMPAGLYVAMILGVLFSVVIGAGLMGLLFYSSRHGYDEHASGRDRLD